jgi:phospholipid-binding lipoprotein MlaA
VILAVGIISLASAVTASGQPRNSRREVSQPGERGTAANPSVTADRFSPDDYEVWQDGVIDANVPSEARRQMALRYGVADREMAQASPQDEDELETEFIEYDPWESFNRAMFSFNLKLDRYLLKPVAKVWNFVIPDLVQQSLANAFDNIAMPRRLLNNLFQLKAEGAGRELARFFLNISMGVGGFFDVATELGVPRSDEDTGQTLGYYGMGPGPYLILPFLPPLTVRDGFGFAADGAMQPLTYVAPTEATVGMRGGQIVNDRSQNLETFEEFERATFDLYSATRNAYLQRRKRLIEE